MVYSCSLGVYHVFFWFVCAAFGMGYVKIDFRGCDVLSEQCFMNYGGWVRPARVAA